MSTTATARPRTLRRGRLSKRLWIRSRWVVRPVVRWLGPPLLGLWARTWTVSCLGQENLESIRSVHAGHFMALWHGRMLLGLPSHAHYQWHVLVSRSGDGDLSSGLLHGFGYQVIRGSSSRGGASAVQAMLRALRDGSAVIVTPDGPRGPRHSTNEGLAWMARATGFPILPCGFACDRAWRAKSWDRFTVPKLGARVVVAYGEPVLVPPDATDSDLALMTAQVRDGILSAETEAFASLGQDPDW